MLRRMSVGVSLILLVVFAVACGQDMPQAAQETTEQEVQQAPQSASVNLQSTEGNNASGTVNLMPMGDGVHFMGDITGLPAGTHGFHIHETGDCSAPDATSAGGHFNPGSTNHGAPDAAEHHAGDLGNIEADASGNASVNIMANGVTLGPGANSIMGKGVIVHAAADDFQTQPTGNAGARLACGVIQ